MGSSKAILSFRLRLLTWYSRHKRDLPWRRTRDPYAILVSEIMLQQTQVKTVLPYYSNFLKTFPKVQSLARAPIPKVLKAWAGLGYYRRARHLHEAARQIARAGAFPKTPEGLKALKGVGPYTAAAVGSIAFGLKLAVVDGNVIRVLARVLGLKKQADAGEGLKVIHEAAKEFLDPARPGDFNQAMMELGALVCVPGAPRCPECPVQTLCQARKKGLEYELPLLNKPPKTKQVHKAVAVIVDEKGRLLMGKRAKQERMGGLWRFPEHEIGEPGAAARMALYLARELMGPAGGNVGRKLAVFSHTVMNFKITVHAFVFEGAGAPKAKGWSWISLRQAAKLPFASAEARLLREALKVLKH